MTEFNYYPIGPEGYPVANPELKYSIAFTYDKEKVEGICGTLQFWVRRKMC